MVPWRGSGLIDFVKIKGWLILLKSPFFNTCNLQQNLKFNTNSLQSHLILYLRKTREERQGCGLMLYNLQDICERSSTK
ncbi:hypothetical protein XELAEV_18028471mg [Xenopus laevis]|uniref:Uncharacterized protein n=1 Tax=Xenopus laevis TaxID=8355 RepID=A0A974HGV5_XENLA|nr:hypothetical protein XELAEV_18028471mg [Xenopus laevis]